MDRYFPLYVKSSGVTFFVAGGGRVAARRVKTLLAFQFKIRIVSRELCPELKKLISKDRIQYIEDVYRREYLDGCQIATACTDDRNTNREIGRDCRTMGIPVSVCDRKEECTFYFPAVAVNEELVCGICGGENHRETSRVASEIRRILSEE